MSNKSFSLRKKIMLLALVPVAIACLIFAILTWTSGRKAANLVRTDVTNFMIERTQRSLLHGYKSSEVTYNYVTDLLTSQLYVAQMLMGSQGGVAREGTPVPHLLLSDASHVGGTVEMMPLRLGRETVGAQGGRSALVQEIAKDTGATVIIFQRIGESGDFVRVAASSPKVPLGTFLASVADEPGKRAPDLMLVDGNAFVGRSEEAGVWNIGHYEPLRDNKNQVVGALYLGLPVDGIHTLLNELAANAVGARGSVAILYAHGAEKGKVLEDVTGIAATTKAQWMPRVFERAPHLQDGVQEGVEVKDAATTATAIVRYAYLPRFDWILVSVADSRDLDNASMAVRDQFRSMIWASTLGGLVILLLVGGGAWVYSQRIVDPLLEVTIQLTSNGTQVASSAKQQLNNATSFNVSSTEIATAVKEISATSQELVRAMQELSQESVRASVVAREGSTGLRGLSSSIQSLSTATQSITDSLRKIREKAARINNVTNAVTKVADQTNLLSLNAAIEAEKAGEAGAGFAVVAREIRRLADQSAQSSQEIEQTILEMQDAVTMGAEEVRSLAAAMEQSIQASVEINAQFTEIISRVESMTPRYEMVHLGMQNQSEGAQQISEAMWQLSESANQTSEAITELNGVSLELHQAVRMLKQRVFAGDAE